MSREITLGEYLAPHRNPPDTVITNAINLLEKVNKLLADPTFPLLPEEVDVNSGWRPETYNSQVIGAAKNSKHITGNAIDLADPDGLIDEWLGQYDSPDGMTNSKLAKYGLYRENAPYTKGWCHLQDVPPKSGKRTFNP